MAGEMDSICLERPTTCLKIPLKSTQKIYIFFFIPVLVNCILYLLNFSADVLVAVQHFKEGNTIWGASTIALIYLPAIVYFILTISRPDWWMVDDDKVPQDVFVWFAVQVCHLFAFPLFALYRFAGLIVLIVDAIMLSGTERRKSLNLASAPAAMELYFFLQAWFQAAPQALLQTHLLFKKRTCGHSLQSVEISFTEAIQIFCIIISIILMAIKTTSFQRYESERIHGRKLPWAMWLKKYKIQELNNSGEKIPLHRGSPRTQDFNLSPGEDTIERNDKHSDGKGSESRVVLERQVSTTPPLPPKNVALIPPPTPLRRITSFPPIPVPDMPAPPRPDSIVTNSSETARTSSILESEGRESERNSNLIISKPKESMRALQEDEPFEKLISFLLWFFFILARVLSIGLFLKFFPLHLFTILGFHYALMLAYLFYYAKYQDITTFFINLWLGFVYIFSLIEYRINFKYADKWLLFYCTFVILQNLIFTSVWFFYGYCTGFWYNYSFYLTFICMGLCIFLTIIHHMMYKSDERRVYTT